MAGVTVAYRICFISTIFSICLFAVITSEIVKNSVFEIPFFEGVKKHHPLVQPSKHPVPLPPENVRGLQTPHRRTHSGFIITCLLHPLSSAKKPRYRSSLFPRLHLLWLQRKKE